MKLKHFLSLFMLACSVIIAAQVSARTKKSKHLFKLVSAYSKTISEDHQSNPPMAGYFFVVEWQSAGYPETIFWRGDGGWLTCNIERANKVAGSKSDEYTGTDIAIDKIKKGDLLLLTPVTGGRFPIPAEIPESAKNTLFYKVGGSAWMAFPVKKIVKK